jgi:cyclopropane-fatty-acyl-phospholipid synthase
MAGHHFLLDDWLLREVRSRAGNPAIRIDLESRADSSSAPAILYRDHIALVQSMVAGECGFGDGYAAGRVRVVGDLIAVLEELYRSFSAAQARKWMDRALQQTLLWTHRNSHRGSRRNIHQHYDIGTDFYRLWLDSELLYTCAYFDDHQMTLDEAQQAKMELICRKVHLQPGERVVDAGCGWGALALYMVKKFGAVVRGYNISSDQIEYARKRSRDEGVAGRVEFVEDDYRSISGSYDVFVSIGMLEHVGASNYRDLGKLIHRVVGDTGRGLLHFIGRDHPEPLSAWINERIFPGAYVPTLSEALPLLEASQYAVLDIENLRPHYARTLELWLTRYEQAYTKVVEQFGEEFGRAWRLYLAGSVAAFRTKTLQLYQVVFAGRSCTRLSWDRKELYVPPREAQCTGAML